MLLGYNTNGLAHHDPLEALELLAEIGYRSVAITLDHAWLNPYSPWLTEQMSAVDSALSRLGLRSVIETGARFLLDARVKHEPTLVSTDPAARARRVDFYRRAIDIASALGSDCVSLWSGVVHDGAADAQAWQRLEAGLSETLAHAERRRVPLGFEPEPGMFIDTMARFEELTRRLPHPLLRLTLDVGHLHCLGEVPIAPQIVRWADRLANVHLEDMRRGAHQHLMFGEGEIDFGPVLSALAGSGYGGGLHVELSRHSHDAVRAALRAMEFLRPLLPITPQA